MLNRKTILDSSNWKITVYRPDTIFLASLLMGVALRNIPGINVAKDINDETGAMFREIALTVILTRAGLEIEPEVCSLFVALKASWWLKIIFV